MERTELKHRTYLKMAVDISKLSKDENTQNGAIIVGGNGASVSWGYNGTVSGFRDDVIPHSRESKDIQFIEDTQGKTIKINKYPFMCHAETNAIHFADDSKLEGSTIYITGMPCGACALEIAKKKIARVMVPKPPTPEKGSMMGRDDDLTKFIFTEAEIQLWVDLEPIRLEKFYPKKA